LIINWNNIRAIEGQREGFEELVCQLAGQEKIETQVKFTRIGKPDGGKECFWELSNGSIHCWQAKYFLNSLSNNQWTQVDNSVKIAIDNHSQMAKYYVVIPVDRPDGKGRGKSMLQKWNDYVTIWEKYASSKKMKVTFEYWGKHELEFRLRKPESEGLAYYFFNEKELTDSWFKTKNQENIDALGGRYTPELNFNLPFLQFLNGFTRDKKFCNQINSYYEAVLDKHRSVNLRVNKKEMEEQVSSLNLIIEDFRNTYESLTFTGIDKIPFDIIGSNLDKIYETVKHISDQLNKRREDQEEEKYKKGEKIDYYIRPYHNELHSLQELQGVIYQFIDFLDSDTCRLANNPYLILIGPAGIGKSHSLADIVSERNRNEKNSLLLLGENFSTNELPWTQILRNQLRMDGNENVLLGALNAKAESQQSRIIIIIDALNEGNGRLIWPKRLMTFIRSFHRYPWLGLIVSIRNSFEKLIAPESDIEGSIVSRIYHPGFEGVEYEASIHFFKYYKIIPPGSPMLHPEFQNPLFLKLFCEGLHKKGLKLVPEGYHGISAIIDNFIEGIENKLSQPDQLDYDKQLKLLRKSIDEILEKMAEVESDHLPYEICEEIARNIFTGKCGSNDKQYLKRLISEGILNEDLYWDKKKHYDGIHFVYQRFQDHLIVSALLDKYLDSANPKNSFSSDSLKKLLKNDSLANYNQNLVEALSIQVPERIGKELHEVAPYAANYFSTAIAFIDGLMWRRADTIGIAARNYVNKVILKNEHLFYRFLEASISMATKPNFYFNADKQHDFLFNQSLQQRDSWWTVWLHDKYGEYSVHNSVKRLIDWAWSDSSKVEVSHESIRLAAVMLAWFHTSSNRYLRDAATKAMVSLLQDRISVLLEVLRKFEGVNDPYVYERLYAVTYGCVLRTNDKLSLTPLSEYVFKAIFDTKYVYPHILLRDYARGVIEYTLHLKLNPKIKVIKIRPPYKSKFPSKLPTINEIDSKYNPKGKNGNFGREKWGATAILSSMTTEYGRGTGGYGDFGRYTFQSALRNWEVDYNSLSNYAVERIFELGYDPVIFSKFDSNQGSNPSSGHKERIGKKYQWIAFHEILAKVADNHQLIDESGNIWSKPRKHIPFDGPWNPYVRDIDPTITIKRTQRENYLEEPDKMPWWVPTQYVNWIEDSEQWMKESSDFPPIDKLLTITDKNGISWLNLDIHLDWHEPKKIGEDRWSSNGKRIWYDIGSWFVNPKELKKILKVNIAETSLRDWIPRLSNRYELFSREFYWSPASRFFELNPYYGGDMLPVELTDYKTGKRIAMAHKTALYFLWEEEFDCSKEQAIAYHKPSAILSLGLTSAYNEGHYQNENNDVICFDPSVYEKGPSCLLIRKDYMQNFLKKSGLTLLWIIQGEKQILGNNHKEMPNFQHKIKGLCYMDFNGIIRMDLEYDVG
jgi:hypothetical protein